MSTANPNPWLPILHFWPHGAPAVRCPHYWRCGDYADTARQGSKPGKVQVACRPCASRIEREELDREADEAAEQAVIRAELAAESPFGLERRIG